MNKRLFEILDEMNVADSEDNGARVAICPDMVSCDSGHKSGGRVTMGIPHSLSIEALHGKRIFVLLAIDMEEYKRLGGK